MVDAVAVEAVSRDAGMTEGDYQIALRSLIGQPAEDL